MKCSCSENISWSTVKYMCQLSHLYNTCNSFTHSFPVWRTALSHVSLGLVHPIVEKCYVTWLPGISIFQCGGMLSCIAPWDEFLHIVEKCSVAWILGMSASLLWRSALSHGSLGWVPPYRGEVLCCMAPWDECLLIVESALSHGSLGWVPPYCGEMLYCIAPWDEFLSLWRNALSHGSLGWVPSHCGEMLCRMVPWDECLPL